MLPLDHHFKAQLLKSARITRQDSTEYFVDMSLWWFYLDNKVSGLTLKLCQMTKYRESYGDVFA